MLDLRSLVPLLPVALCAAAGCSLIADADSYRLDLGCDLNLELKAFDGPHQGQSLLIQIDVPDADSTNGLRLQGLVRVDGIPPGNMLFQVPRAMPSAAALIDFYVDNGDPSPLGTYNPQSLAGTGRGDHSWTIRNSCLNASNEFTHNPPFDDFPVTAGFDEPLVFELRGFDLTAHNLEVRVIDHYAGVPAADSAYTRAFLHVTAASETAGTYVTNPLRDMLDRGVAFDVEVFVDRNGDQVVDDSTTQGDAADEGFVFHFAVPPVSAGTLPIPQDPTTDSGHIVLDRSIVGTDDHSGMVGMRVVP